jgi:cullin 3
MNTCKYTPHYIVIYTDNQFKVGFKQKSLAEVNDVLEQVVRIFCCLHGRDTFVHSYTSLLASRLLNKTSVNDEAEKSMISKLQVECGHNTVNKIKTMFEDIAKSQQMMSDFKQRPGGGANTVKDLELEV